MTTSTLGLITGLLLAIAIVTGGLVGFLLAIVLGGGFYLLGAQFDGEVDLRSINRNRRG